MTDTPIPNVSEMLSGFKSKPQCGTCRFGVKPARLQGMELEEHLKRIRTLIECRWGPPTATIIPIPAQGGVHLQGINTFPDMAMHDYCFRHEPKMDA